MRTASTQADIKSDLSQIRSLIPAEIMAGLTVTLQTVQHSGLESLATRSRSVYKISQIQKFQIQIFQIQICQIQIFNIQIVQLRIP